MNTFSKIKTEIVLSLLSKGITAAVSKKIGVDCNIKIKGLSLDIEEQSGMLTAEVNASASIYADDVDKLIFQGGKKDAEKENGKS